MDADVIRRLTFPAQSRNDKTSEPLQFAIHGGDILFGRLRDMDDKTVQIESDRTGLMRVKREFVNRIQRMNNPALVYLGPNDLGGWETIRVLRTTNEWTGADGKSLETIKRNAELFRQLPLSEQTEFEITLETTDAFGFLISFDSDPGSSIGVETWGDELVIVSGDDYEPLMTIAEGTPSLTVSLLIDRKKKTLSAYSETGKLLGSLQGNVPQNTRPGFYLRNKSRHLRLKHVRVSKSTGAPPLEISNRDQRIRLVNGSAVYGQVERFDAASGKFMLAAAGDSNEPRSVLLKDIDSLTLSVEPPANPAKASIQAQFADGGGISGSLLRIRDDTLIATTSYMDAAISAKLDNATQINRVASSPDGVAPDSGHKFDALDMLESEVGSISGIVELDGSESDAIRWRLPGGQSAVAISSDARARISRKAVTAQSPVDRDAFNDQVFLKNHDSFPCKIEAIDEEFLHFTTPLAEAKRIPLEALKAVEFAVTGHVQRQGFGGDGWQVFSADKEAVTPTDEKIEFINPAAFGHMGALDGDRVGFDVQWGKAGGLNLKLMLMATNNRQLHAPANLHIYCQRESVMIGSGLGFAELFTLSQKRKIVPCPGGRAHIDIHRRKNHLRVEVNGALVYSTTVEQFAVQEAKGLAFSVTGDFGLATLPGADDTKPRLTVSNFVVWQSRTKSAHQRIQGEIKTQTLTIPRSRKRNPSTNVLIALNGDLLRGRLTSVDRQRVAFDSRLESFRFDRHRIAAIVWLHPEIDTGEETSDAGAEGKASNFVVRAMEAARLPATGTALPAQPDVRVAYSHGINVTVRITEVRDGHVVGESDVLGRCRLPLAGATELHFGGYGKLVDALAYSDWTSSPARQPQFATDNGAGAIASAASKLTGTKAVAIHAALLDGGEFRSQDHVGKVVILDFWATWCVPCVKAMPAYLEALKGVDPEQVVFIAVNQDEPAAAIKKFLKLRNWNVKVALDPGSEIGREFRVEGIPQTVVIRPDGNIESVHQGYRRGAETELRATVDRLLREFPTD